VPALSTARSRTLEITTQFEALTSTQIKALTTTEISGLTTTEFSSSRRRSWRR